jgi:hypothetical protein
VRAALPGAIVAARDHGLDPAWPPVLIALVILVLGAALVSVIVVLRALRSEARAGRRGHEARRFVR